METKLEVTEILKRYSEDIDHEITRALETVDPESLRQASEHLVKAGGKKLRPSLAVLSALAVGGQVQCALKTGAAVELIHTFSLIHDDIMDQDDKRRANHQYTFYGENPWPSWPETHCSQRHMPQS